MKKFFIAFLSISFLFNFSLFAKDDTAWVSRLENQIVKVAERVGKAVVSISCVIEVTYPSYIVGPFGGGLEDEFIRRFFEDFFGELPPQKEGRISLGSGFIFDKQGYILTNAHVVSGAKQIKVTLADGRQFSAELRGVDNRSDLAVIKIRANNLPTIPLGDSDALQIGNFVFALGNPFGISTEFQNPEPTLTFGVISALHRYLPATQGRSSFEDLIQTDAAINPGNSGGPLVNINGQVVGVNVAILSSSGGFEGVGFAIPINKAKRILASLIKGEKVLYGWLGVSVQELTDDLKAFFKISQDQNGVVIVKVFDNSPAQKAGLKEGDIIISFGNETISNTKQLISLVTSANVGQSLPMRIIRDGKELILNVKIAARPDEFQTLQEVSITTFRGMEVENINPYLKQRFHLQEDEGVVIVNINPNSPAARAGLKVGDVILKIGEKKITNRQDFEKAVLDVKGSVLIKTSRGYFVLSE